MVEKFKPERPIYLNEENTGLKTRIQVDEAIEKLRSKNWLVTYGQKSRPFHMSFASEKEFQEFKKEAGELDIKLVSPLIKPDEFEEILNSDSNVSGTTLPDAEQRDTYEDPEGRQHINE
jgi:hypothetical protein